MKFLKPIILITLMIIYCLQQFVIILVFNYNQKYIAANLCVNRKKLHSCCQGKCFLNKSLEKNTDNSSDPKAQVKYKMETFVANKSYEPLTRNFILIEDIMNAKTQNLHSQNIALTAFHPPDLFV